MGGFEVAQKIEEQAAVLLKNDGALLPLDASKVHSIAIIGPHADVGMISGGGSAQVDPPGGNAIMPPGKGNTHWQDHIWFPTSPLKSIRAKGCRVRTCSLTRAPIRRRLRPWPRTRTLPSSSLTSGKAKGWTWTASRFPIIRMN